MKRTKRNGFSLLEVIAAVVILAVVAAATVATVAPMRAKSEAKLAEQEIATLNSMAQTFFLENGAYPVNVDALVTGGYINNTNPVEAKRLAAIKTKYSYARATGTFTKR